MKLQKIGLISVEVVCTVIHMLIISLICQNVLGSANLCRMLVHDGYGDPLWDSVYMQKSFQVWLSLCVG